MIQSALYFALGFLAAVLLALLVVPPIWRRATFLARKRIEAETPLTLNEIQAQRDGLRAEHAMETRKLEMRLQSLQEKVAAQLAEFSEKDRLARRLSAELLLRDQSLAQLQEAVSIHQRDLEKVSDVNAGQERLVEQRAAELELLHRRLASVASNADSLQIEAAAQSARIENLSDELKQARQDKRDSDEVRHKAETELKALERSIEQEGKRSSELEQHSNALLRQLADSEEKLARREKEIERINERLRKVLAEGRKQGSSVVEAPRGKDALALAHESEVLREQMNGLAAQVVAMVARLEGQDSPINDLLSKGDNMPIVQDPEGKVIPSLADRIRALQRTSSES